MMTDTAHPLAGSDAYWQQRRQAFAFIRELEQAIKRRDAAPQYLAGPSYDPEEGFDDVIENTGPWDRVAALQDRARVHRAVVEILTAQRRLALLSL